MLTCSSCQRQHPSTTRVCPHDGTVLVSGNKLPGTLLRASPIAGEPSTVKPESASSVAATLPPENRAAANLDALLASESAPIVAGTMFGEYEVTAKLGEGGMGEVYAAVHPIIGKKVAIKVLADSVAANKEVVRRFVDEARAVNQIGHPNIVDVFSFGQHVDGRHYFVMEHLSGCSLEDEVDERGIFPAEEIVEILVQTLDALQAAHEANIVHRDLKPDNIFLIKSSRGQSIKLLDFGIAKLSGDETPRSRTQTGVALGTPDYMSPEQCKGIKVDLRTDIYASGVILYRMFTGHFPFENATSVLELFMQVAHQELTKPSVHASLPQAFEDIILKCMAKEPSDRYASARELADALEAALENPGALTSELGDADAESGAESAERAESEAPERESESPEEALASDESAGPSEQASGETGELATSTTAEHAPAAAVSSPQKAIVSSPTAVVGAQKEGKPSRALFAVGGLAIVGLTVGAYVLSAGGSSSTTSKAPAEESSLAAGTQTPSEVPLAALADAAMPATNAELAALPDAAVEEEALPGKVVVKTNLKRAEIFLDGEAQGGGKKAILKDLVAGSYHLEVRARGYESESRNIEILAGALINEEFSLKRAGKKPQESNTSRPGPGETKDDPKNVEKPLKDTDTPLDWP